MLIEVRRKLRFLIKELDSYVFIAETNFSKPLDCLTIVITRYINKVT